MAVIKYIENEYFSLSHSVDKHPIQSDFDFHIHDTYELFCLVRGNVDYMVEGRLYKLSEGAIMLMRPSESHSLIVNSSEKYERYVMNFKTTFLYDFGFSKQLLAPFRKRELGEKNMYLSSEFKHVSPLFYFESMFLDSNGASKREIALSALTALLCQLGTLFTGKKDIKTKKAPIEKELIEYVNQNLTGDITISSLAEKMHLSQSQLCRLFKRSTGTSVHDYIISKRLILFNKKIKNGLGVLQACHECGFYDYSAFYRLYKKRFGISPKEFKGDI